MMAQRARRGTGPLLVFGLSILLSPRVASANHNLLPNGDFDTGISGWTVATDWETDFPATLDWDPGVGNRAPGSLRLIGGGRGQFVGGFALSECFEPPLGTELVVRARSLADTEDGTVNCFAYISNYTEPGCQGSREFLGSGDGFPGDPPGVWQTRWSIERTVPQRPSFRVALFFRIRTGEGPAFCHFDSVELFVPGTVPVVEVPAASKSGLVLLGLTLALGALWVLRRT
jgi:hypothetical protein